MLLSNNLRCLFRGHELIWETQRDQEGRLERVGLSYIHCLKRTPRMALEMTEKHQHTLTPKRGTVAVKVAVSILLAGGGVVHAQMRFDVVSHEMVAAVPSLEIVSVRDRVLDNCYTLFLFQPQSPAPAVTPVDSATLDAALSDRNRKLDALSADLQRQVETPRVVTVPNPLRVEFDGQKALVDFEQIAMEAMVARVDARLAEIATAPRLAVAGPVICPAVPPATKASRPAGHP